MNNLSLATKFLYSLENSASAGMFLRDTGGCLIPKVAVARSLDEVREVSFAEIAESFIFYFSITPIAYFFSKLFAKMQNIDLKNLSKPLSALKDQNSQPLKSYKLAKLGKIAATFSILLPLIYAIAPLRNLITLANSGKEQFTAVVNLNNDYKPRNRHKAKQKLKKFLSNIITVAGLGLTATAGLFLLAKNPNIFEKIQPFVDKTIKHFDFKGNAGLTLKQLGFLVMPVSIASYFAASRDKYEVLENARRFMITVPMMFFGQDFVEKSIYKYFDKLFHSTLASSKGIKTYDEILKLPPVERAINLKSKNWSIAVAFLINTMAIAGVVGLLNRITTKKNFMREQQKKLFIHKQENQVKLWQQQIELRKNQQFRRRLVADNQTKFNFDKNYQLKALI